MGPCFLFDSLIVGNSDSTVKVWILQAIPILRDYVIMEKKDSQNCYSTILTEHQLFLWSFSKQW